MMVMQPKVNNGLEVITTRLPMDTISRDHSAIACPNRNGLFRTRCTTAETILILGYPFHISAT